MNGIPDFDPKELRLNIDPTLGNVRFTPFSSTVKVGELGLDGGLNKGRVGDEWETTPISDEKELFAQLAAWFENEKPTSLDALQEKLYSMDIDTQLRKKIDSCINRLRDDIEDPAEPLQNDDIARLDVLYDKDENNTLLRQFVLLTKEIYGVGDGSFGRVNDEVTPPANVDGEKTIVNSDRANAEEPVTQPEPKGPEEELSTALLKMVEDGKIKSYEDIYPALKELTSQNQSLWDQVDFYVFQIERAIGSLENPNMSALDKLSQDGDDNIVKKTLIQVTKSMLGVKANSANEETLSNEPKIADERALRKKLLEMYQNGDIKTYAHLTKKLEQITDPSLKDKINGYIAEINEAMGDAEHPNMEAVDALYKETDNIVRKTLIELTESVYRDKTNADLTGAFLEVTLDKKTYSEKMAALEGDERFYTVTFSGGEGNQPRHRQKELNDLPLALLHSQMVSDMTAYMMELKDQLQGKTPKEQRKLIIDHHEQIVGKDKEFEKFVKNNAEMLNFQSGLEGRKKAVENRKKELTKIKYKDIEKALGKALTNKLQAYIGFDPTEENYQDKEFDLSELSDFILKYVGEDYMINYSEDWEDENRNITIGLNGHFGNDVESLTDEEALVLAKFCGYEVEKKDHTLGLGKLFHDGAEGALAAGFGHAVANSLSKVHVHVSVIQNMVNQLNLDSATAAALAEALGNSIDADVSVALPFFSRLGAAMATGALTSALASLLIKAIIGEVKIEESCFPHSNYDKNNPLYTDRDKYIQMLKKSGLYDNIKPILDEYPENADGTWNHEEFFNELRLIAGLGSKLNCDEILAAILNHKTKPKPDKPATSDRSGILFEDSKVEPGKVTGITQEQEEKIQNNYAKVYNVNSSDWYAMVDLYPCLAEAMHDKPGQITRAKRAIAVIQGGDPRYFNYNDTELINRIVDLSFQYQANRKKGIDNSAIIKELESIPHFDWKVAWAHWQHYQTHRRLPQSIAGCERPEITKENLKAKKKYTKFADRADVQRNLKPPAEMSPATIVVTPGKSSSYAKAKYIDETGAVVTVDAKDEASARQMLEEAGIAPDKITTAKDQDEFDKFGKKQEEK